MSGKVIHRKKDARHGRFVEDMAGAIELIAKLSRRKFLQRAGLSAGALAGAAAGLLPAGRLLADEAVQTGKVYFPRLQFSVLDGTPDIWNVGPVGDANLRKQLSSLTNINISNDPKVVRLADFDDMCRNPFVFMTSEGFFKLPDNEEKNLKEFLERGGFVHADDCVFAGKDDRFFRTYRDLMDKLFPDSPMRKIPDEHELYRIYFEFKPRPGKASPCPHMQGVDHGAYGLFERGTGRIMTIATPGDLHCGWMDRYPFGDGGTMASIKMGINIVIYFLSH